MKTTRSDASSDDASHVVLVGNGPLQQSAGNTHNNHMPTNCKTEEERKEYKRQAALTRREREREEKGKKERRREQLRAGQQAAREKKRKAVELPLRNMIFLAASPVVRSMLETNREKAEIQANYEQTLQTMMQARASAVKARNDQHIASLREVRRERADQRLADREARRAEQAADEESINNRWLAQQRDDNEGMVGLQDFANNHAQRLERMSTVKQNRAEGIR
jgi:septal ring-binding cell division protein DamX